MPEFLLAMLGLLGLRTALLLAEALRLTAAKLRATGSPSTYPFIGRRLPSMRGVVLSNGAPIDLRTVHKREGGPTGLLFVNAAAGLMPSAGLARAALNRCRRFVRKVYLVCSGDAEACRQSLSGVVDDGDGVTIVIDTSSKIRRALRGALPGTVFVIGADGRIVRRGELLDQSALKELRLSGR